MQFAGSQGRHNTAQMVVQRAALIVRIVRAVVVTVAIMAEMMAVNVIRCAAGFGKIGGDVSLSLYDVLQMGADQRRYAGDLGKDKHCQKPRANAPPDLQ